MWLTILFGITAAFFLFMTCATLFHLRWVKRLPALAELGAADLGDVANGERASAGRIQCSVIIPARDEEARIEDTVRRVLAQRDVQLEVIVVDDRSTDRTGEILRRLAEQDTRIRTLRVEELPAGWLGKCHASYTGAANARGDWLLFTDADCWLQPDVLARALRAAERGPFNGESVDHVTLTPGTNAKSAAARAWHLAFVITLASWFAGVNRDRPKAYLGTGAFNLVRAAAYRECGGYEALRLTVVDDMRLSLLLRRAGKRTRAYLGGDDAECHWGATVRQGFQVLEKNYFAAIDFRLPVALGAGLGSMLFWCIAIIGPFTGTAAGIAAGLAMLSLSAPACVLARRLGWGFTSALATPLVFPALFYALLNSTWVTTRQGGIFWRETFYSLEELRAGGVR